MPMMNTRRLDTDDEEHLDQSTREASSSSLSVSPSEQSASSSNKRRRSNQTYTASGVAFFALPAAGPHPNAAIQYYEDLPVQRTLDWQRDDHNQLMTREFTNNLSRLAAFVQTRGDEAPWPCSFCRDGLGVWQSCIIGSDTGHSSKIHGSCANCRFSRRYNCDHRINREKPKETGTSLITRKTGPSSQSSKNTGCRKSRPVANKEAEGQAGPSTQRSPSIQEDGRLESSTNEKEKEQAKGVTYSIASCEIANTQAKCKHDGKAIPFPLRPEAFHNLEMMRQSLKDLAKHYNVIKRRIEQIEGTEPHKGNGNPWDIIAGDDELL